MRERAGGGKPQPQRCVLYTGIEKEADIPGVSLDLPGWLRWNAAGIFGGSSRWFSLPGQLTTADSVAQTPPAIVNEL